MHNIRTNISCAILAGGKNSRIGGINKAFIRLGDTAIINSIISETEKIFSEIMIVTNNVEEYNHLKEKHSIVTDIIKNVGPLGGIHSALANSAKQAVFVISCDMPFPDPDIINKVVNLCLSSTCDAVVPDINNLIEPLCAVYKKNLKNKLEQFISQSRNYSIRNFLQHINVSRLNLENNENNRRAFTNINSFKDLENAEKEISYILV